MDAPDEIPLGAQIREEKLNSPLGPIKLRWTREVEKKFGRNPMRATVEAASAVSRVLRLGSVPSEIQKANIDWNIAFMDDIPRGAKIPQSLVDRCHPGWMTPPARIYIVGSRISSGCSDNSRPRADADDSLSQVVVHEIAHAVEHSILGNAQGGDRPRAEGFATWFEIIASRNSSLLNEQEVTNRILAASKKSIDHSPGQFVFDGSSYSYSRMASYFAWFESRYGTAEIFRVYDKIKSSQKGFLQIIIEDYIGTTNPSLGLKKLDEETLKFIKSKGIS